MAAEDTNTGTSDDSLHVKTPRTLRIQVSNTQQKKKCKSNRKQNQLDIVENVLGQQHANKPVYLLAAAWGVSRQKLLGS